MSVVKI